MGAEQAEQQIFQKLSSSQKKSRFNTDFEDISREQQTVQILRKENCRLYRWSIAEYSTKKIPPKNIEKKDFTDIEQISREQQQSTDIEQRELQTVQI